MIIDTFTRRQFYSLLDSRAVLPLIIFAMIFGVAVLMSSEEVSKRVYSLFGMLTNILYNVIRIVMIYGVFCIFSYFAALSASLGVQLIGAYLRVFVIYTALAITC